jgi:arachidonate 15-lipoxygenase
MGLHSLTAEQQGLYRYDPSTLKQKGPARLFPAVGDDGLVRYVLTQLRHSLAQQGHLSEPWSLLLQQLEQLDRTVEENWLKLSTLLVDLQIFQSGWFNFDLPPGEPFDANFVKLRREMGSILNSAKDAAAAEGADAARVRSRFFTVLEQNHRNRPLISQIYEREGELSDREFARQRLAGQNPMILRRVQEPDKPFLEAWNYQPFRLADGSTINLQQAADARSLFIASYPHLDQLKPVDLQPGRYVGSPKALFYRTNQGLEPVLIEIEKGRMLTPPHQGDGKDEWMRAKLWVQTADVTHHEVIDHLCNTHLRMEAFAIATPRQLPPTHPVYRLLRPHFQFLLAINTRGNVILIGQGGAIGHLLAPTREASLELINQAYQVPFEHHALPKNIELRGIEPEFLPDFPYRDDALLLWDAIADYVTHYLQRYYPDDTGVEQDPYLQAWAAELGAPLDTRDLSEFPQPPAWLPQEWVAAAGLEIDNLPSYPRIPGFPATGAGQQSGKLTSLKQLIDIATQIIFTCGPQHAAVNFSQFDYVGYVPNAPFAVYDRPEADVSLENYLPPAGQELEQIGLTFALSGIRFGNLGNPDLMQFKDRGDRLVLDQFNENLAAIETKIKARNRQRLTDTKVAYPYLLPSQIPNSINI